MIFFRLRRWLKPKSTPLQDWEKDRIEALLIKGDRYDYVMWLVNRRGYKLCIWTTHTTCTIRWHFSYHKSYQ